MGPEADPWLAEFLARTGDGEEAFEAIVRRPSRLVVRAQSPVGPAILKLWDLSDTRSRIRASLGRSKGRAEYHALTRLAAFPINVPKVYGYLRLGGRGWRYEEALWMQDLGPCVGLDGDLHDSAKAGHSAEVKRIDEQLIVLTKGLINAQVFDNDHRISNLVKSRAGELFRIDFENAQLGAPGPLRAVREGRMIGALVASYTWMTRYDARLAGEFVEFLLDELRPSRSVRRVARRNGESEIRCYAERSGFSLPTDLGL